jgi:uncharacterized protein (DUF1330 family)
MADTPVYLIVNLHVEDEEQYLKYEKGFFPILKEHGGQFITFDDNPVTLEGEAPRTGRMVILSFPSEEAAKGWYNDPKYQALSEHRRAGTKLEFLTMVHGMPPR